MNQKLWGLVIWVLSIGICAQWKQPLPAMIISIAGVTLNQPKSSTTSSSKANTDWWDSVNLRASSEEDDLAVLKALLGNQWNPDALAIEGFHIEHALVDKKKLTIILNGTPSSKGLRGWLERVNYLGSEDDFDTDEKRIKGVTIEPHPRERQAAVIKWR